MSLAEYFDELSQFRKSQYETFKILEYYPLSSKRAHKHLKGEKNQITNQDFKQTYERFLIYSFLQNNPDSTTFNLVFTYYLILQDRIEEAEAIFKRLKSITVSVCLYRNTRAILNCSTTTSPVSSIFTLDIQTLPWLEKFQLSTSSIQWLLGGRYSRTYTTFSTPTIHSSTKRIKRGNTKSSSSTRGTA